MKPQILFTVCPFRQKGCESLVYAHGQQLAWGPNRGEGVLKFCYKTDLFYMHSLSLSSQNMEKETCFVSAWEVRKLRLRGYYKIGRWWALGSESGVSASHTCTLSSKPRCWTHADEAALPVKQLLPSASFLPTILTDSAIVRGHPLQQNLAVHGRTRGVCMPNPVKQCLPRES